MNHFIVVDADVIINWLRGYPEFRDLISEKIHHGYFLFYSVLTKTEVLAVARKNEIQRIEQIFNLMTPIAVTLRISEIAGDFLLRYHKSHSVGLVDAIVAASSVDLGNASLLTGNKKHYPMPEVHLI